MTAEREAMTQKIKRMRAVADVLRRIQEFESARYLDEYADVLTAKALDADEAENYRDDWFDSNTGRDCQRTRVAPAIDAHLSRAAEPVAWVSVDHSLPNNWFGFVWEDKAEAERRYASRLSTGNYQDPELIPLYTHPPEPARDAKDAKRFHWLLENCSTNGGLGVEIFIGDEAPDAEDLIERIDAAMAQESGE